MSSSREDIRFEVVRGEDYSAYIEWVDVHTGKPIATGTGSAAWLQARDADGSLAVFFDDGGPVGSAAVAEVLSTSGIIRLTAPRQVTITWPLGVYRCDLFVSKVEPGATVFATGQRRRVLHGWLDVIDPVTQVP